jgi:hypothetical protein
MKYLVKTTLSVNIAVPAFSPAAETTPQPLAR